MRKGRAFELTIRLNYAREIPVADQNRHEELRSPIIYAFGQRHTWGMFVVCHEQALSFVSTGFSDSGTSRFAAAVEPDGRALTI